MEAAPRTPGVRTLYISYFGIDEPLVQTQVLPYLRELAARGVRVSLLTFEPDRARRWPSAEVARRRDELRRTGVDWHLRTYHRRPSLPATLWDTFVGTWTATSLHRRAGLDVLHGRSHVGAVIAVLAGVLTGARAIFDVRGFLADEYVATGHWRAGGLPHRVLKGAERWLHRRADAFVFLTHRARELVFPAGPARGQPVEVIPCGVDLASFELARSDVRATIRAELGASDRTIYAHVGTVGGPYSVERMVAFLGAARARDPGAFALVLTRGNAVPLGRALAARGWSARDHRILSVPPSRVPAYLCAADVGLMILRPRGIADAAASPTKFAEYLAAGLPVVATDGVGDCAAEITRHRVGVLLPPVDDGSDQRACEALRDLRGDPDLAARARALARSTYDLRNVCAPRYRRLYDRLMARATEPRVRVSILASYPLEAASTRYRASQFVGPLAECGIDATVSPFLDGPSFEALYRPRRFIARLPRVGLRLLRQLVAALRAWQADVVIVQREALLFGPPVIEWLAVRPSRRPLVLDLDDGTYLAPASPIYGRVASWLKPSGKTDRLIAWSSIVTCGNPAIARYVESKGGRAVIVPTVVDAVRFRPGNGRRDVPVVGWIGTHGTYPYLTRLLPILARLARAASFRVLVVGSGREQIAVPGVEVETRPWALAREADDLREIDVGVYPLPDSEWTAAKSGLKAVHYMMSGVASVISPVGVCAEVGRVGQTHLAASSDDEWLAALGSLVADPVGRRRMGAAAREFAARHYTVESQVERLASTIRSVLVR